MREEQEPEYEPPGYVDSVGGGQLDELIVLLDIAACRGKQRRKLLLGDRLDERHLVVGALLCAELSKLVHGEGGARPEENMVEQWFGRDNREGVLSPSTNECELGEGETAAAGMVLRCSDQRPGLRCVAEGRLTGNTGKEG